ncbi:MAG: hypothetical protein RBS21_10030 [Corynebacterium sp.]|nr:hypothetical protein [Corynebacterium sp.]
MLAAVAMVIVLVWIVVVFGGRVIVAVMYVMVECHVDSPGNASTDQKWIWLCVRCDRSN